MPSFLHAGVARRGEEEGGSIAPQRLFLEELRTRNQGVCEEEAGEEINEADGVAVVDYFCTAGLVPLHLLFLHVADN